MPDLKQNRATTNIETLGLTTFDIDPKLKEGGIKIKIKIGALKYSCKKGIGFRCGGSVGPYAKVEFGTNSHSLNSSTAVVGRNLDRLYDCAIREVNGGYEFEFLEIVDWAWLEETEI